MVLKWIEKNIEKIYLEESISIHLDELNIKENYFVNGIILMNQIVSSNLFESIKNEEIKIELQFELINSVNNISCVPKKISFLKSDIDINTPPELVISLRKKGYLDFISKIEYYMSPLPFAIEGLNDFYECHYSEYRTMSDVLDNSPYVRWFTIVGITGLDVLF